MSIRVVHWQRKERERVKNVAHRFRVITAEQRLWYLGTDVTRKIPTQIFQISLNFSLYIRARKREQESARAQERVRGREKESTRAQEFKARLTANKSIAITIYHKRTHILTGALGNEHTQPGWHYR